MWRSEDCGSQPGRLLSAARAACARFKVQRQCKDASTIIPALPCALRELLGAGCRGAGGQGRRRRQVPVAPPLAADTYTESCEQRPARQTRRTELRSHPGLLAKPPGSSCRLHTIWVGARHCTPYSVPKQTRVAPLLLLSSGTLTASPAGDLRGMGALGSMPEEPPSAHHCTSRSREGAQRQRGLPAGAQFTM